MCGMTIIAPIWKPHATDWDMEASHHDTWVARITDVIRVITDMDADIVNIQEYWFDTDFREMFEGKSSPIAARYHIRAFQRTGRKPDGELSFHLARHTNNWLMVRVLSA